MHVIELQRHRNLPSLVMVALAASVYRRASRCHAPRHGLCAPKSGQPVHDRATTLLSAAEYARRPPTSSQEAGRLLLKRTPGLFRAKLVIFAHDPTVKRPQSPADRIREAHGHAPCPDTTPSVPMGEGSTPMLKHCLVFLGMVVSLAWAGHRLAYGPTHYTHLSRVLHGTVYHREHGLTSAAYLDTTEHVVLYFAASWCAACQEVTPLLRHFYTTYAPRQNFEILLVPHDRSAEALRAY